VKILQCKYLFIKLRLDYKCLNEQLKYFVNKNTETINNICVLIRNLHEVIIVKFYFYTDTTHES